MADNRLEVGRLKYETDLEIASKGAVAVDIWRSRINEAVERLVGLGLRWNVAACEAQAQGQDGSQRNLASGAERPRPAPLARRGAHMAHALWLQTPPRDFPAVHALLPTTRATALP